MTSKQIKYKLLTKRPATCEHNFLYTVLIILIIGSYIFYIVIYGDFIFLSESTQIRISSALSINVILKYNTTITYPWCDIESIPIVILWTTQYGSPMSMSSDGCEHKCIFTNNRSLLSSAAAVLFFPREMYDLPNIRYDWQTY